MSASSLSELDPKYVAIGGAMSLLSLLFMAINMVVLRIIIRDRELRNLNSYKFMFALGVADCLQLVIHFLTGLTTIWHAHPVPIWFNKMLGAVATPGYVFYVLLTIVLALNRLISLASTPWDNLLFSSWGMKCWMGGCALLSACFSLALASPWASILYFPALLSWAYDDQMPFSFWVQRCEMVIEIGGIFVSGALYTAICALIIRKKKYLQGRTVPTSSGAQQSQQQQQKCQPSVLMIEVKVLIQAFVITAYCTVLNILWHNADRFLPQTQAAYCALNFMWIGNGAVNPLIYFFVNVAIRQRLARILLRGVAFSFSSRANNNEQNSKNKVRDVTRVLPTMQQQITASRKLPERNRQNMNMLPMHNNFVERRSSRIVAMPMPRSA